MAIKGLGGFHLAVAARNDLAVTRLRERKRAREAFGFDGAVARAIRAVCEISNLEERLCSRRRTDCLVAR